MTKVTPDRGHPIRFSERTGCPRSGVTLGASSTMRHTRLSICWFLLVFFLVVVISEERGTRIYAAESGVVDEQNPSVYEGLGQDEFNEEVVVEPSDLSLDAPARNYLFIHDTSKNMRKKKRIPMMQTTMRKVLDHIPRTSRAGLRAFGHRFSLDGPDYCTDTDIIIPVEQINRNREDFETQLNLLTTPPLGGGAPVGLALRQGMADLQSFDEPKELFLYLIDLQECPDDAPLSAIQAACSVKDLHVTLIGIGLKRDFTTLQQAEVERLACVDVVNILTPEDAEVLPDKLLTRLSVKFENAEGVRVDPAPGSRLELTLSRLTDNGETEIVREKVRDASVKGTSIETVGLDQGTYFLDLSYEGQQLRSQHEMIIFPRDEISEVIQLGKMLIDVNDFRGNSLGETIARALTITLLDAGKVIRTVKQTAHAEFDVLPGNKYKVQVSYNVGGNTHTLEYQQSITIQEGNHKNVAIALPFGSVTGTIIDMEGQPTPQVEMTLTSSEEEKRFEQKVLTDEQGRYFFPDVNDGTYTLALNKAGYKREEQTISVVGGQINEIEDTSLFRGIEILVAGVSGKPIDDADVSLIHKASTTPVPLIRYKDRYRNIVDIVEGDYIVSIQKAGYQSASQEVGFRKEPASVEVPFHLPYYITLYGNIVNGKNEIIPDAIIEFHNIQSTPELPEGQDLLYTNADGTFQTTLTVTGKGEEQIAIVWQDMYNQTYRKEITFPLPPEPQKVALEEVHLPINFLFLSLNDVLGNNIIADTIILTHHQSGQSGIQMNVLEDDSYESTALLDGDYTLRIFKKGYQEVEHRLSIQGGMIKELPVLLYNYVTVTGTVIDGKNNRVAEALIEFQEKNSTLTSLQPILTGKDGRFQATLLVRKPEQEQVDVIWKSPETEKEYRLAQVLTLPGKPVEEFEPKNLGHYQLPANFVRVEVQDVFGRGLSGVEVQFISSQGEVTRGVELGSGMYESFDLYDGNYNVAITKTGYKENVFISDIAVGRGQRDVEAGGVQLPHYATVSGTVLNGKDEGMSNVELSFGGKASEQLERCRTDQFGKFTTTLLVTGAGKETWKAAWGREDFSTAGVFSFPVQPTNILNVGEIRLPVNFISIPVEDIRGKMLTEVNVNVSDKNGDNIELEEFLIGETEPGIYQAQNLPDGEYLISFYKNGYEVGKILDIAVKGGEYARLQPIKLGYYVTVKGKTINGKHEAVANATVTFQEMRSTVLESGYSDTIERGEDQGEGLVSLPAPVQAAKPILVTDRNGEFSTTLLVTSPGIEELVVTWAGKYTSSYQIDLMEGPMYKYLTLKLPINFVVVEISDISGKPLSEGLVTLENQLEEESYALKEIENGTYHSKGIPDGSYTVRVGKTQYQPATTTLSVQTGEVRQANFRLHHYITVKGHVIDGKQEGISAAIISFANLKTKVEEKVISGTDGAFETQLLVQELGRESGEIIWAGKHGTYTRQFRIDLPTAPQEITLTPQQALLPINYITVEVKSVAATGIAGANVRFTHQKYGMSIEARDNDNGNYEGEELPDGIYDILVTKDKYQTVTLHDIHIEGGEHKSDILVSKFSHYITMSGIVLNGKNKGVPNAFVTIKDPKRLRDYESFTTREDGSFTLNALVTDVGSETIEVLWNDIYTNTLAVKLPLVPEHVQLEHIKLPINFIAVNVHDIYGVRLSDVIVSFVKKQEKMMPDSLTRDLPSADIEQSSSPYMGREIITGVYESPDLPDNKYIIIVRKDGYVQDNYPEILVSGGENISDVILQLPHLITITGRVTNGKDLGVPDVIVNIAGKNSEKSRYHLETDLDGYFSERLQINGTGKEILILVKEGTSVRGQDRFELSRDFIPLTEPGIQEFEDLRLPMNFIPIQVQDVAGRAIDDAIITVRRTTRELSQQTEKEKPIPIANKGHGEYEGNFLQDGIYRISVEKDGYETQERSVEVEAGEVASEVIFTLPHYVVVKGIITQGKGDGIPDTVLEFDTQNSQILPINPSNPPVRGVGGNSLAQHSKITTNINGQFTTRLLVKHPGDQTIKAAWKEVYTKEFSFPLPEKPDPNYILQEDIRLPINFSPFNVTNILDQGLAGVEIRLHKGGDPAEEFFLARPFGGGYYEAQELLDGMYSIIIQKEGYQAVNGEKFSVEGGEFTSEHVFALPHYVTIQGRVVNGKGVGVEDAEIMLAGLSSQLLYPEKHIVTAPDGSFQIDVLVTGSETNDLREHLEVSWTDTGSSTPTPFKISYDFSLPTTPLTINLGLLPLPANFSPIFVKDISEKGLSGVEVIFTDENAKTFRAKELTGGYYEGQNLPDGIYTVDIVKEGYQKAQTPGVRIVSQHEIPVSQNFTQFTPLIFKLPYYVDIAGTTVNGKGQELTSDVALTLAGPHSHLLHDTISFDNEGNFSARLLVNQNGREQLQISWEGEHGFHSSQIQFVLPDIPQTMNFQRLHLPVNFIPIEVKDLNGYGMSGAMVKLYHIESEHEIMAQELGNGQYEGQDLLDGSYEIFVTKDGYKPSEHGLVTVSGGIVSETRSFRLQHYVWITGIATNGNGVGVSDPLVDVEEQRSLATMKQSDITGKFDVQLEVLEVGNERLFLHWKNKYRFPVVLKLPEKPGKKDLGEIRLPINFISILVSDISGSTLAGVTVEIQDTSSSEVAQTLKSDQNGFCKTDDLPNGQYQITVRKPGYKTEARVIRIRDGNTMSVRFTLPHYIIVKGQVKDVRENIVGDVEVIFEEFFDNSTQKLRTTTDPETGTFEQKLLINDSAFLERQKGHFLIHKGDINQLFTFKIPTIPNQVIHYKTLLFPINYLYGKIVDTDIRTVPIPDAQVSLIPVSGQLSTFQSQSNVNTSQTTPQPLLRSSTDSLGTFEMSNLRQGEYKITIQKEGYIMYEDFIRISGLLQEQEFTLRKE